MLLSFRVSNHRSLRDEQELDLRSIYDPKRSALNVVALYGANASGKTSVIEALRFMCDAVTELNPQWVPGEGIPRVPFRLDDETRSAPSSYSVELLLGGVRYTYGFTIDDSRVLEEWCYSYPKGPRRILVERTGQNFKFGSSTQRQRNELLAEITPPGVLFISTAARTQASAFVAVSTWFRKALWITDLSDTAGHTFGRQLLSNEATAKVMARLLQAADLGDQPSKNR